MNPGETIWRDMKEELGKGSNRVFTAEAITEFALEQWAHVRKERLDSLIKEIPKRIKALIDAKGGHTRY